MNFRILLTTSHILNILYLMRKEKIVEEMMTTTKSERTTRVIDFDQDASMEQKKREGYF